MQNIRGMSSIIQVTLLTALSIIALSLIWGYVYELSGDLENQLSPAVECISQKSKVLNSCVNSEGKIEVNLDVSIGEEINSLGINFKGESFLCGQTCGSCTISSEQGRKKVYLDTEEQVFNQDKLIVSINGCLPNEFTINSC